MNLVIQKNNNYTVDDFFSNIIHQDYVDGLVLNVAKTNDDILVAFNLQADNNILVKTIYTNSFHQLKNSEIITLRDVIQYLERINYKKKIILNLIPFQQKQLTEEQNKILLEEYQMYAKRLKEIIKDDSNLSVCVHSVSRSLITVIKNNNVACHYGFAIVGFDLNYIDLDYYVFTVDMINFSLIKQELDRKKEVFIYIGSDYDLSFVYDKFVGRDVSLVTKEIFDKIYLIGNYPEIMKKTFLEN